jgi:hypothetical protein
VATLYITEYSDIGGYVATGTAQIAAEPEVASQTVSFGASTQSSAFNAATRMVRLHTDSICSVKFGTNPTATTTNRRMPADATEYFSVPVNSAYKVAAVTNT